MLEKLKKLNPTVKFFDIYSKEFAEYGRVIDNYDISEVIACAEKIDFPSESSVYLPSVEQFEKLESAQNLMDEVFGTIPTQIGYCYGYNGMLNAAEWHSSSEINVAVTPLVLILGKRTDICEGRLNSADMKAFYVPKGAAIEVYATTLHFCPCQVSDDGFGCIVGLPLGTNTPLEKELANKLIFRKNKWIIAHDDNKSLIERGVVSGIYGENYKINY